MPLPVPARPLWSSPTQAPSGAPWCLRRPHLEPPTAPPGLPSPVTVTAPPMRRGCGRPPRPPPRSPVQGLAGEEPDACSRTPEPSPRGGTCSSAQTSPCARWPRVRPTSSGAPRYGDTGGDWAPGIRRGGKPPGMPPGRAMRDPFGEPKSQPQGGLHPLPWGAGPSIHCTPRPVHQGAGLP